MRTAAQTAIIMAVLTLISKCVGFIREMVMANYFGTSYVTDAYVMANSVPSILFGGLVSSIATAYMPVFSKIIEGKGQNAANQYTSAIINLLLLISALSSVIGLLFPDQIVHFFARGFNPETAALTSSFLQITFSFTLATAAAGILNAYLQYKGVFITQVIIGYTHNICLILFIIIGAYTNNYYIIFGYLSAYILQIIAYAYMSKKKDYKYSFSIHSGGHTRQILSLALPIFIGCSAGQIGQFVDKTLASGLPQGSVAALNYGTLLAGLITGLTVTIINALIYPKLSQAISQNNHDRFNNLLSSGFSFIIIIMVPCTLGAMVYSSQIVQLIYERGMFDSTATNMTTTAFFYYAIGIPFQALYSLLCSAYYSLHNTKVPAALGFVIVMVDIAFNFILVRPLAHGGLALATSIGAIVGGVLYYVSLRRLYPFVIIIAKPRKLLLAILSSVISIGLSWIIYHFIILSLDGLFHLLALQLVVAVSIAIVVYYILLSILRFEEIHILTQIFRKRNSQ